jgi:hypothetical protein
VAAMESSYTGQFLKRVLARAANPPESKRRA